MRALAAVFLVLPGLAPALAQTGPTPYDAVMAVATVKKVIVVDTIAGRTGVLLASIAADPRIVFVFAPGGEGRVGISADGEGRPVVKGRRNPAFVFAMPFLEHQAAWAVIDVPADFGTDVHRSDRITSRHVEAVAQVAGRIREAFPKARHILIGHSNGGITAGMQAVQPKPSFDGVVMSAPAIVDLPFGWKADAATMPIMFITHKHDECRNTQAYTTIRTAGSRFPLTVIDKPVPGDHATCRGGPAPHFFSGAEEEYAAAILKWVAGLK
jgi:predicted esterase